MVLESPPAAIAGPDLSPATPPIQPGLLELFVAFAKMSLAGFGGVLVWARRGIVDQHRWMTAEEFNETFALCHFLPGPNIVNLSVVFGSRFRGIAGGIAAFAGLVGPPMVIATILAALYARYGEIDALRRILAGTTAPDHQDLINTTNNATFLGLPAGSVIYKSSDLVTNLILSGTRNYAMDYQLQWVDGGHYGLDGWAWVLHTTTGSTITPGWVNVSALTGSGLATAIPSQSDFSVFLA